MEITAESTSFPNPPNPPEAILDLLSPSEVVGSDHPKAKSFKEALAIPKSSDFYFDDAIDTILSDDEEKDEDGDTNIHKNDLPTKASSIPRISLPKKLLQQIRKPWTNTLIVRLLGKSIGYRLLYNRVKTLWAIQEDFDAIDLGNNYFLFKFSSQDDCNHVYTGGPWVIMDHYLTIRKWEPDFKVLEAFETTTAVWVRFPELPIEYFQEKVLYTIAKQIGKPLKIDLTTTMATRDRYARVCIEMDLNKPLCPRKRVLDKVKKPNRLGLDKESSSSFNVSTPSGQETTTVNQKTNHTKIPNHSKSLGLPSLHPTPYTSPNPCANPTLSSPTHNDNDNTQKESTPTLEPKTTSPKDSDTISPEIPMDVITEAPSNPLPPITPPLNHSISLREGKARVRKPPDPDIQHGRGDEPPGSNNQQDGRQQLGAVVRVRDGNNSLSRHYLVDRANKAENRTRVEQHSHTSTSLPANGIHAVDRLGPS
ncbi:hypothetical protein LOK49_LG02G00256 [Camellia lanceoleosa]|uniref:Uncharacterized protein n=1 Tax=Camellia lanceoleosa TaxID=1840588 RepID=A0ACC0IHK3_9ERIC|nr:hypothetical protein LOK49_LG02G00256 [Camellia lanceoleosa]